MMNRDNQNFSPLILAFPLKDVRLLMEPTYDFEVIAGDAVIFVIWFCVVLDLIEVVLLLRLVCISFWCRIPKTSFLFYRCCLLNTVATFVDMITVCVYVGFLFVGESNLLSGTSRNRICCPSPALRWTWSVMFRVH